MDKMQNGENLTSVLKPNYELLKPKAEKFMFALREQLEQLLATNSITLAVPIESRIKQFDSMSEKIKRNELQIKNVLELNDFVGIRLILLFKRDLEKIHEVIMKAFKVLSYEDTGARLSTKQFGYQSFHYIVGFPDQWLKIPSLKDFGSFKAEIQVRTLAQHMWAAASHVLQYKQESSVPLPIMRSIYRVSAILETIDFEFERLLHERESYILKIDTNQDDIQLNVDVVQRILDELLPKENKGIDEDYGLLIKDLNNEKIYTVGQLRHLIVPNLAQILKHDKEIVKAISENSIEKTKYLKESWGRAERGVFFVHSGLVRDALEFQSFKKLGK